MAVFFMLGKYSQESVKGISAERTKKATALIQKFGGKVTSIHALLGEYDLALIVELSGVKEAMKVSLALNKLTGIFFRTLPALTVEEFDKIVADT